MEQGPLPHPESRDLPAPRFGKSPHGFRLQSEARVAAPLERVFAFFSDCRNLEALTPPHLRFDILTPGSSEMRPGLLIDYRLSLHGIPMYWQSEITVWEPPFRFVDEQRRGPYRRWIHEHRFREENGETVITDSVDYAVPGGGLIHNLFVRAQLARIFRYRTRRLTERFR